MTHNATSQPWTTPKPPKKLQPHFWRGGRWGCLYGLGILFWGFDYLVFACTTLSPLCCWFLSRALTMLGRYTSKCMDSIRNIVIIGIKDLIQLVSIFSYSIKLMFDGYHNMKNLCILKLLFGSILS